MLTILNIISLALVLVPAAHYGWLGETLQFKIQNDQEINPQYDRELLLAIALVQAGKGSAEFTSEGFIKLHTEDADFTIYGKDYTDAEFGVCYRYAKNNYTQRVSGALSLSTRKYLRDFKEEHLGVRDPSSIQKPLFGFKKEKVTIK